MRTATNLALLSALALLGCGRELAQTAFREPTLADATSCEEPLTALPPLPPWADVNAEPSVLVGGEYGAGEGPGLWLVARDAYRVYLNGALVGESETPRGADFIPLSLLPGDNHLAVVVWAAAGTPAALLQLDDLDRSYVTDPTWRVETAPGSDFLAPGYTPRNDAPANGLGRLGSLPGCDPTSGFPVDSLAQWIGTELGAGSSAVLRQTIRLAPIGFGSDTTGGGNATPVVVETWEELLEAASEASTPTTLVLPEGVYDFRRTGDDVNERAVCPAVCSNDAEKQFFTVLSSDQTCENATIMRTLSERTLELGSNKTLVGLGRGAQLRGVSLRFGAIQNVIVRNLALYDVNRELIEAGDALGLAESQDVWIDHVTTKWISDGFTDVSAGTRGLTLSWMRYDGLNDAACRGQHTRGSTITDSTVTFHHCFFDHTETHAPSVVGSLAQVHIFNDLVQDNPSYGVSSGCGAQVKLEATTFRNVMTPTTRRDCADMPPVGRILAPEGSNLYVDVGDHAGGDGLEPHDSVFTPPPDYRDVLEPAAQAWPRVYARAGAGGPWAQELRLEP